MTRVLLGGLVVSLLTLSGLVTYHSFTWSDHPALDQPTEAAVSADATPAADDLCPACGEVKAQSACCAGEAAAKSSACCEDAAAKPQAGAKK
jgi:hypothetical protein